VNLSLCRQPAVAVVHLYYRKFNASEQVQSDSPVIDHATKSGKKTTELSLIIYYGREVLLFALPILTIKLESGVSLFVHSVSLVG